jgi:hypothetical protein
MNDQELVNALRCASTAGVMGDCKKCQFYKTEPVPEGLAGKLDLTEWSSCDVDGMGFAAADRIANQSIHIAALQKEIEKLRGQNRQLMLERNYVMSIIADVRKTGKTWMFQYCAHCKDIFSGMADCDSKKLCVMPYSQFELKRPETPEVENAEAK